MEGEFYLSAPISEAVMGWCSVLPVTLEPYATCPTGCPLNFKYIFVMGGSVKGLR